MFSTWFVTLRFANKFFIELSYISLSVIYRYDFSIRDFIFVTQRWSSVITTPLYDILTCTCKSHKAG